MKVGCKSCEDVQKEVSKQLSEFKKRLGAAWQLLEDADAARRRDPARRPTWGEQQAGKIVTDYGGDAPN
jgi:hypothetical protein